MLQKTYLEFFDAKRHAAIKLFREYWYDKMLEESELTTNDVPPSMLEDYVGYLSKRTKVGRYKYAMFTINAKEGVTPQLFLTKIKKYLTKKWITQSRTCVEWRDRDKGMHCHSKVWLDETKKTYETKREVYNTFKHLVGNKLHVNVRYSNREGAFDAYIDGFKAGEPKSTFTITAEMRRKYDIPDVVEAQIAGEAVTRPEWPGTVQDADVIQ